MAKHRKATQFTEDQLTEADSMASRWDTADRLAIRSLGYSLARQASRSAGLQAQLSTLQVRPSIFTGSAGL